jgi:NADPH:quinone reductase-like Zn-dependent oxidoreductase
MVRARSVWFRAPRTTELAPLREEQVLVRASYSGISAGTELLTYRGELDPEMAVDETIGALGGTFRYPFQYGYSWVGVVEESRSPLAVGQTVFAFHPHQSHFVADASDLVVLEGVEARLATLFPLVETALQITLDAGPLYGERVVVFGLGTVGALPRSCCPARAHGCSVSTPAPGAPACCATSRWTPLRRRTSRLR